MVKPKQIEWPLVAEFVQRRIPRAAGLYVVSAWVSIQVADVVKETLSLPGLTTIVIIVSTAAFPFAMLLAWFLQVDKHGIGTAPSASGSIAAQASAVLLLVVIGCGYILWFIGLPGMTRDQEAVFTPQMRSVAVLRFLNLTGEEENGYISDGVAEELTYKLSKVQNLRVASRTSAFAFFESGADLKEIAQRLNVQTVLEGSIAKVQDGIDVSFKLINAQTDTTIWADSFALAQTDLMTIQEQVLLSLESLLAGPLTAEILQNPASNIDAYVEYLKGRRVQREPVTPDSLQRAEQHFVAAINHDRAFSRAHAALCEISLSRYKLSMREEDIKRAERECSEGLKTTKDSAVIEIALGKLYLSFGELTQASERFERALNITPDNPDALTGLGQVAREKNRFNAARDYFERAITIEPNNWLWREHLAYLYYVYGHYVEAVQQYERVIGMQPESAASWAFLGGVHIQAEQFNKATASLQRSLELEETAIALSNLGILYTYERKFEEAKKVSLRAIELVENDSTLWGNLGDVLHFGLGEPADATSAYKKAVDLATDQIRINPSDINTTVSLAVYHAILGESELAMTYAQRALDNSPEDPYNIFYVARVYLHLGEKNRAITQLEQAIGLGFSTAAMHLDPVLDELRDEPAFIQLISSGANNKN